MKNSLTRLTIEESKHIKGGRWGGPIGLFVYELIDVWTSHGENLKKAHQNGREAGCRGGCG